VLGDLRGSAYLVSLGADLVSLGTDQSRAVAAAGSAYMCAQTPLGVQGKWLAG